MLAFTTARLGVVLERAGSAGKASLNVETLIVVDDDNPVPAGEVAEVAVFGISASSMPT